MTAATVSILVLYAVSEPPLFTLHWCLQVILTNMQTITISDVFSLVFPFQKEKERSLERFLVFTGMLVIQGEIISVLFIFIKFVMSIRCLIPFLFYIRRYKCSKDINDPTR